MEKIVIIGGRGTPIVIADQIYDANMRFGLKTEVLGLALDDLSGGNEINGYPIVCGTREVMDKYGKYDDVKFLFALYRPDVIDERSDLLYSYVIPENKFTNFIHPSVLVSRSAKIGHGNVILANTVINPNFKIGNFNVINSLCLLGHDSMMGSNNYFSAENVIGSGVKIGDRNFIGLNSTLRNSIKIGNRNIIAMASNVVKDVQNDMILMGNPAKQKEKLNNIMR